MLTNDKTTKQPTHLAYHVEESQSEGNGFWTKVGAMWPHKDGKGWGMQLQFLPVDWDGRLTIRLNEPKEAKGEAETQIPVSDIDTGEVSDIQAPSF